MSSHAYTRANIINNQDSRWYVMCKRYCWVPTPPQSWHFKTTQNITRKHRTFDAPTHTNNNTGYIWQSAAHHRYTKYSTRKSTRQNGHIHTCTLEMRFSKNAYAAWRLSLEIQLEQDAQLSQRDRAAGCVTVFAKSRRLELEDNILRTL